MILRENSRAAGPLLLLASLLLLRVLFLSAMFLLSLLLVDSAVFDALAAVDVSEVSAVAPAVDTIFAVAAFQLLLLSLFSKKHILFYRPTTFWPIFFLAIELLEYRKSD